VKALSSNLSTTKKATKIAKQKVSVGLRKIRNSRKRLLKQWRKVA
jgi:hypothetical protein